jgi:membrane protein required for colicin V production
MEIIDSLGFNGLDFVVLALLLLSCVVGVMRGLAREAFSLAAWVLAFWLSGKAAPLLGPWLPGLTEGRLRDGVAIVLAFIAVLLLTAMVSRLFGGLVKAAGLTAEDRFFGLLFGCARGVVALLALTLLAGLTALPQTGVWRTARLTGVLTDLATATLPLLPESVSSKINLSSIPIS